MSLKKYVSKFEEGVLISNEGFNNWANTTFKKYLPKLNEPTIVWLQDDASKYQGYYSVVMNKGKKQFNNLSGVSVSKSTLDKYNMSDEDIIIIDENKGIK